MSRSELLLPVTGALQQKILNLLHQNDAGSRNRNSFNNTAGPSGSNGRRQSSPRPDRLGAMHQEMTTNSNTMISCLNKLIEQGERKNRGRRHDDC